MALSCWSIAMLWALGAGATIETCRLHGGEGYLINYCSNHGMYNRRLDTCYRHLALVLDNVRRQLTEEGKLEPLPVLVEVPFFAQDDVIRLEKRSECTPSVGDTEEGESSIGPCYRIVLASGSGWRDAYAALLALTVRLGQLKAFGDQSTIERVGALIAQNQAFRRSWAARAFLLDMEEASDRAHTVRIKWLNGKTFPILDQAERARYLPAAAGELAVEPHFTPDGRWVAYAGGAELVAFDTHRGVSHRVRFGKADHFPSDIRLGLPEGSDRIWFALDWDYTFGYETIRSLDLSTGKVVDLAGADRRRFTELVQAWDPSTMVIRREP